jgi:hypothetical protein
MAWWIWGMVSWAAITTLAVLYLVAVCLRKRRAPSSDLIPDDGSLPDVVEGAFAGSPVEQASVAEAPVVQAQREPALGTSSGGGSPQSMTRLPPGALDGDRAQPESAHRVLGRLVEGARAGNYTLPQRLVDAHRACRLLGEFDLPAPGPFGREEAAARLVSAAMDSRPLDPMGLCAEVHRSRTDRLLYQEALELLGTATRRAEDAAVREAAAAGDSIIVEHLRPAYREVVHRAHEVARRLGPYIDDRFQPDTPRIITATLKVRNAYLALPELVRRHSSILAAREWANTLGERTPQCDGRGLFAAFENPLAFAASADLPYEGIPVPPLPDDDTARLLWLVSDEAAAGRPWLPTVAEQDAAWRARFGRPVQVRTAATAD